jgi:quercetin dioxygenase-like cupin family protein
VRRTSLERTNAPLQHGESRLFVPSRFRCRRRCAQNRLAIVVRDELATLVSTSMIIAPTLDMEFPGGHAADVGARRDPNLASPAGIRVFDIGLEALDLALSTDPVRSGRTIARLKDLRLTVMSLKQGSTVKSHKTDHEISIQTITGRIVIHTAQGQVDLPSGRVAVLDRDTVHDIEAVLASAILITVSVAEGPGEASHGTR